MFKFHIGSVHLSFGTWILVVISLEYCWLSASKLFKFHLILKSHNKDFRKEIANLCPELSTIHLRTNQNCTNRLQSFINREIEKHQNREHFGRALPTLKVSPFRIRLLFKFHSFNVPFASGIVKNLFH